MKLTKGIKFEDDPEYKKIEDERIKLTADRSRTETEKTMDDLLFGSGAVRRKPRQPALNQPAVVEPTKPVENKKTLPPTPPPQPQPQPEKKVIQVEKKSSVQQPKVKKQEPRLPVINETRATDPGRQGFNRPSYIRKLKKIAQNFEFTDINQRNHTYIDVVRPFECDRKTAQLKQTMATEDHYHDKQFPTSYTSVGNSYRRSNINWRLAQQLTNRPCFGKYVQPNDIELGKLTCPSFASILSCLAQRQRNIKRLIQDQQFNGNGFYYVRLNINSVWRYIAVDDYLPSIDQDNLGILSFRDNQSDIALSIIEKAYAKAYNGYDVFEKKCKPEHYLRDLTGARVAKYNLNDSTLLDNLQFSLDQNWTIVAVPNRSIQELGISSKFNLGVIGLTSRGLELRNSWGTIVQRPKLGISKQGVFQLSFLQANKYFDCILVAETDDHFHTTTVQSKHETGFYSSYTFRLSSAVEAVISASQWDHRLFPHGNNYDYSSFRIVVDRKKVGSVPQYVAGAFAKNQRNLDLLVQLSPGEYVVTCIGSWSGSAYDYSITLYGNHAVKFERNYTEQLPNIISQSLQEVNLANGKRSSKGHVDEYILYHEPTNLVLLTNLNISEKPYDYTQDLSKINYNTLNLLNAPNQKENFGSKLASEVSQLKQNHNSDRRWSIHLEPKQAYTWVISTSEPYNSNNFKTWGFK